jgi:hypothetical protein
MRGPPTFPIGFDGEKLRRGEKCFGVRKDVFAGGFAISSCFVVVKSWFVCGGMRGFCGALCGGFFAAENMPTFWNLFLGFPVLGNGSVKEGILQGLKPLSCQATNAKPEGLAYLEAKATAACPFRMAVWARFALSLDGPLMR